MAVCQRVRVRQVPVEIAEPWIFSRYRMAQHPAEGWPEPLLDAHQANIQPSEGWQDPGEACTDLLTRRGPVSQFNGR